MRSGTESGAFRLKCLETLLSHLDPWSQLCYCSFRFFAGTAFLCMSGSGGPGLLLRIECELLDYPRVHLRRLLRLGTRAC